MTTGTATLGFTSAVNPYASNNGTMTIAGVSVTAPTLFWTPELNTVAVGEKLPFTLLLPSNGKYKLYFNQMLADNAISIYTKGGKLLTTFTGNDQSYTLPEDTSVMEPVLVCVQSVTTSIPIGWARFGRFGLSRLLSFKDFVKDEEIENMLLPMQAGESFTKTSNGAIMQLRRTFTADTQLLLYRFTAAGAGSLYVTSNNPYLVDTDPFTTTFLAGQNFGDTVTIKNTMTTPTDLTLTLVINGVGTEQPLHTQGYVL